MKLGIGTYAYAWSIGVPGYPPDYPMTHAAFLRRAQELGVRLVQFADNLPLNTLSPLALEAVLTDAQMRGIALEVGTRGIQLAHLRPCIALARRAGSAILRVVVDTAEHHPTPEDVVALVRAVLPDLEAAHITLAIENHDRFKARTLAGIIETLASPYVGICLDTVNSFGALEGPEVVVEALGRHVVNLHVKDFTVQRVDHHMGFVVEGTPAGQGLLDMAWLLGKLAAWERQFNAILELWPAPEATLAATIAKEDAWAVASIPALRRWIPA